MVGGYTEDSVNVWGNDIPYLKGVKDFSNSNSSASNWTVSTSRSTLEGKLNAASKGVGKLKSIQLTPLGNPGKATADRGVSGRIKSATFVGTAGKVTVSGDDLRGMLGLKSTLLIFMSIKIQQVQPVSRIILSQARMIQCTLKVMGGAMVLVCHNGAPLKWRNELVRVIPIIIKQF